MISNGKEIETLSANEHAEAKKKKKEQLIIVTM